MNLQTIGQMIASRRRELGLTLAQLATRASVGRSTLAALEAGTLPELGLGRVARLCAAVDLVLEVRAPLLGAPLLPHRHLTPIAGRELTKAAIDDIITRGDMRAWRALVAAMRKDSSGRIARRVRDTANASARTDERSRAFAKLLPRLLKAPARRKPATP